MELTVLVFCLTFFHLQMNQCPREINFKYSQNAMSWLHHYILLTGMIVFFSGTCLTLGLCISSHILWSEHPPKQYLNDIYSRLFLCRSTVLCCLLPWKNTEDQKLWMLNTNLSFIFWNATSKENFKNWNLQIIKGTPKPEFK